MSKETHIHWHDINFCLSAIKDKLTADNFIPDIIVAVGRGGLIPGTLLAYNMDVGIVVNYAIKTYSNENTQTDDLWIFQSPNEGFSDYKHKNILVVDDLSDSGNSLKYITEQLTKHYKMENIRTATLCTKTGTKFVPDYFIQEYPSDTWLVFPWEINRD
jgi:hypoxanthine phosphoribosyltransferase